MKKRRTKAHVTRSTPNKLMFCYGSNLCIRQLVWRCPDAEPVNSVLIKNWKLVFRGVADIVQEEGAELVGGIWRISEDDEFELDIYEGVKGGLYSKKYFRFQGEPLLFYKMNSERIKAPSEYYYKTIEEGYKDFGLDLDYLEKARQHSIENEDWIEKYHRQKKGKW